MKAKHLWAFLIILFTIGSRLKGQTWNLPPQDADSLSTKTYSITFDPKTKNLEINKSGYWKLDVSHSFSRYTTSIYEIDTIALLPASKNAQLEIRFLLCDGRDFTLENPYTGEKKTKYEKKGQLRLGYWLLNEKNKEELATIVNTLNGLCSVKNGCNAERDLRSFVGHDYQVNRSNEGVYRLGATMPSFLGSNSITTRQEKLQSYFNECLGEMVGDDQLLFVLNFVVNENGEVEKVQTNDCPLYYKERVLACLQKTKWEPGIFYNEKVSVEVSTLIGFNYKDNFAAFEERSKEPYVKRKVPDNYQMSQILGYTPPGSQKIYSEVDKIPTPKFSHFFEELTLNARNLYPGHQFNEIISFVVEPDGRTTNIKSLQSSNEMIAEWLKFYIWHEADFYPGVHQGKPARVQLNFYLQ